MLSAVPFSRFPEAASAPPAGPGDACGLVGASREVAGWLQLCVVGGTAEPAASGFGLGRISFLLRRRFGGTFESEVLGEFCGADG